MKHRRPVLLATAALTLGSSAVLATSSTAHAAPSTCQGKAVTIVATRTVTQGTEGDDVVAMEPDGWNTFKALGGNDTICLAAGAAQPNDRDPVPPFGFLDAGAGDDTVVNLMAPGTTGVSTTVVLGLGSDTYQGADVGESVYAEKQGGDFDDPYAIDPTFVGAQSDVVTGAATVHSAAPNDGTDLDRITFGHGAARVVLDGAMGSGASIDVTAASSAALELPRPSRWGVIAPGTVTVDNRERYVEAAGVPKVWWTGDVETFTIGHPLSWLDEPAVSFVGGPAPESVTFADVPMGVVRLGSGDDSLTVQALNHGYVPRAADGGPGRDSASIHGMCRVLAVRLDDSARCDAQSGTFSSFHDVVATSSVDESATTLVGTARGERLVASGESVRVDGRGGSDEIGVDDAYSARVRAGAGADRIWASGDDVVVRGQGGRDRIRLLGTAGISLTGDPARRQVALGGRGNDVLIGTSSTRPDRLVGGPGRDRADGRAGRRDFCTAEVTRRCERP